jgi:hypothetical protein
MNCFRQSSMLSQGCQRDLDFFLMPSSEPPIVAFPMMPPTRAKIHDGVEFWSRYMETVGALCTMDWGCMECRVSSLGVLRMMVMKYAPLLFVDEYFCDKFQSMTKTSASSFCENESMCGEWPSVLVASQNWFPTLNLENLLARKYVFV